MELTAGSFRAEPHDVIAGDQHVVGLHLATAQRQGRTLADRQVLVVHVRDGKIAEVWEHVEDQYAFDEFYSQSPVSQSDREPVRPCGRVAGCHPAHAPSTPTGSRCSATRPAWVHQHHPSPTIRRRHALTHEEGAQCDFQQA
jgi:hypothetical protein